MSNKDPVSAILPHPAKAEGGDCRAFVQAHLSIPVVYKDQVIGLLSLQWKQPCQLHPDDLDSLDLIAQTLALALASLKC